MSVKKTGADPCLIALKLKFEARDTTIDPDDWANAICAWMNTTTQRRKVSAKRLVQELALDSSLRKGNPITPMIARFTATDQRFKDKVLRALCSNPRLIFDDIDMLLLSNWRVLCPADELKKIGERQGFKTLPGLRNWQSRAVRALFDWLRVCTSKDGKSNDGFSEWFKQRKHRLGLTSGDYLISDFNCDTLRLTGRKQ
jgi:hypothetical protein